MGEQGSPESGRWKATIRRWLWLDRSAVRNDRSEANRGFYPGGFPVYSSRKPVGRRFVVPVVALGIVIAVIIMAGRDAEATTPDQARTASAGTPVAASGPSTPASE